MKKLFILTGFASFIFLCNQIKATIFPEGEGIKSVVGEISAGMNPDSGNFILYRAFSHNDYWRPKPLFDALSYHFNCVEADLWLVDGELYVAHDKSEITPVHTFEDMYLKPLIERIKQNGGKVYANSDRPFFLMVDCKSDGERMYPVLKKMIEPYKEFFCSVHDGNYKESAVLFFLSGDRPLETLPKEPERFVFLDGRVEDLNKGIASVLMPVISDNYRKYFSWDGKGEMPDEELRLMRRIIEQVHKEGKLVRWWGAPDTKLFRQVLLREGVDLIGTDDLEQLYDVLMENRVYY